MVDDDEDIRGAVATFLELHGYTVCEASNGREALHYLADPERICLILLDLFMPEMNGWAFRQEQAKDARAAQIPVIVISADSAAARQAASTGVIAALTKPVEFDTLLDVVSQHC
ncbi:MAG TPA: response regulator [Terriglobales bacterium]|nr:response regulator [Terriglobales bacterium]